MIPSSICKYKLFPNNVYIVLMSAGQGEGPQAFTQRDASLVRERGHLCPRETKVL